MASEIDALEIKITESTSGAEKRIDGLIANLNKLKQELSGISGRGLKGFVGQLNELNTAVGQTSGTIENIDRLAKSFQGLQGIANVKLSRNFSVQIRDLAISCMAFTDDVISRTERMSAALQGFNGLNLRGLKSFGNVSNMPGNGTVGTGQPITPSKENVEQTTRRVGNASEEAAEKVSRLSAALTWLRRAAGKIGGAAFGTLFSFLKKPFVGGIDAVKKYTSSLSKLGQAFGRILLYRTLRRIIKEIADAFNTGVNSLYQWSKGIGGQFAASMDRAASSLKYLKNSIGAAVAPLINALVPVLEMVVERVVAALNLLNQFIARLTGATTWTKATYQASEYAAAAGSAAGSTKKLLDYTLAFDELNVFSDNSGSGGGGGGGGMSGYEDMFEDIDTFENQIVDFVDRIKEAIQMGDWEGVGAIIAEKVNSVFDKDKWKQTGEKIGKWINNAILIGKGLIEKTNFTAIGESVAEFLNGALENINFNELGKTIARGFTGILDSIGGFIATINWRGLSKQISRYVIGLFDGLSTWISNVDWGKAGRTLVKSLKELISGIDVAEIAKSYGELLLNVVSSGFDFAFGSLEEIGYTIWDWIGIDPASIYDSIGGTIETVGNTLNEVGNTVYGFLSDQWSEIEDIFNSIFGDDGSVQEDLVTIEDIFNSTFGDDGSVQEDLKSTEKSFHSTFGKNGTTIGDLNTFKTAVKTLFGKNGSVQNDLDTTGAMFEKILGKRGTVQDSVESVNEKLHFTFSGFGEWMGSNVTEVVKEKLGDMFGTGKDSVEEKAGGFVSNIKTKFGELVGWTSDNVTNPMVKTFDEMFKSISDILTGTDPSKSVSGALSSTVGNMLEAFQKSLGLALDGPYQSINNMVGWLRNIKIGDSYPFREIPNAKRPTVNGTVITQYANGGLPASGELFLARENGLTEMVGRFGNRTAVANNGQIEEGIARATERGNNNLIRALYAIAERLAGVIEDNATIVNVGDEEIGRANDRYQSSRGTNSSKGAFANAW